MVSRYDPGSACSTTRASPVAAASTPASPPLPKNQIGRVNAPVIAIREAPGTGGNGAAGLPDDITTMLLHRLAVLQAA